MLFSRQSPRAGSNSANPPSADHAVLWKEGRRQGGWKASREVSLFPNFINKIFRKEDAPPVSLIQLVSLCLAGCGCHSSELRCVRGQPRGIGDRANTPQKVC